MAIFGNNYSGVLRVPMNWFPQLGSRANHLLSNAYVHGTSGPSIAIRYQARSTADITEFYMLLDDFGGTLANVTMGCIICNEHASTVTQAGTTVRATATAVSVPNAADKWVKATFGTPYTPAIGETLWFVFYNTSVVPTVDYPIMLSTISVAPALNVAQPFNTSSSITNNGFSTAGTTAVRTPWVVVHGSEVYGQPHTGLSTLIYTSSAVMRGFQIRPPIDIEVCGWMLAAPTALMTGLRIYDAATAPGGTPLYTHALGTTANQSRDELIGGKVFAPFIMSAGATYNVVATYASAYTLAVGVIEDYASYSSVFDALIDYFTSCPSVSDVAGSWVVRKDAGPTMQLVVSDFPSTGNRASYALGI